MNSERILRKHLPRAAAAVGFYLPVGILGAVLPDCVNLAEDAARRVVVSRSVEEVPSDGSDSRQRRVAFGGMAVAGVAFARRSHGPYPRLVVGRIIRALA